MPGESVKKTVGVALAVSLVCSLLVSTAVVSMSALQEENEQEIRIRNILTDLDLLAEGQSVEDVRKRTDILLLDMEKDAVVPEDEYPASLDPANFDIKIVAHDPELGMAVPAEEDIADIRRMPRFTVVYIVREDGKPSLYVFHVYGRGLYSTLYGVIALGPDLRTVKGISFYEHGETPGLGGEVDNPRWKNLWKDKKAFDETGNLRLEVVQGTVDTSRTGAEHRIDGLSGATFTARGVDQLVKFWLGPHGYGPFIEGLRKAG
jgi:Na+-transporting NADH:ubiquinone oxidoreductase subunit C